MSPEFAISAAGATDHNPDVSDALLKTLVESSPLAIYVLDLEGRVTLWNPAAERIFGWAEAEVIGKRDPTVPRGQREEVAPRARGLPSGPVIEQEVVRLRRDGKPIEVAISATDFRDAGNRRLGTMVIAADASYRLETDQERRTLLERERVARLEAEAAERRARFLAQAGALLDGALDYAATLNNLAHLAVEWMADYCLLDAIEGDHLVRVALAYRDPRLGSFLQRDVRQPLSEDPAHHPVLEVVTTGRPVLVEEATEEVLAGISHDARHLQLLRTIGLRSFIVVPLGTSGRTLGAITLAYANSGRRYSARDLQMAEELGRRAAMAVDAARLYRESRNAVEARERLLAIVSHDLRNALATVLLNSSAILDAPDDAVIGRYRDPLRWIGRSAEQMNRLISDLLDASAIEQGRMSVEPAPHSVGGLIQDAAEMYRPLATEKQIELECEVLTAIPYVEADGERVQQVLGNLIGNAIKFSPPNSEIRLRATSASPEEVCFSVADRGSGIASEHQSSIFDLYWRGDRGGRRGAGLGLAIAKAIVGAHGGRIWVESTPGRGSTFFFTLPGLVSLRGPQPTSSQPR